MKFPEKVKNKKSKFQKFDIKSTPYHFRPALEVSLPIQQVERMQTKLKYDMGCAKNPMKGSISHFVKDGYHNVKFNKEISMEFFDCLRYSTAGEFQTARFGSYQNFSYTMLEYYKGSSTVHLMMPKNQTTFRFGAHRVFNDQIQAAGEITTLQKPNNENPLAHKFESYRLGLEYKSKDNRWKLKGFTHNLRSLGFFFACKFNQNFDMDLSLETDIDGQNQAYGMNFNYSN